MCQRCLHTKSPVTKTRAVNHSRRKTAAFAADTSRESVSCIVDAPPMRAPIQKPTRTQSGHTRTQNDLWCSVVPRGDDPRVRSAGGVGGGPHIDEPHLRVDESPCMDDLCVRTCVRVCMCVRVGGCGAGTKFEQREEGWTKGLCKNERVCVCALLVVCVADPTSMSRTSVLMSRRAGTICSCRTCVGGREMAMYG